jgi:hypothetical protein
VKKYLFYALVCTNTTNVPAALCQSADHFLEQCRIKLRNQSIKNKAKVLIPSIFYLGDVDEWGRGQR